MDKTKVSEKRINYLFADSSDEIFDFDALTAPPLYRFLPDSAIKELTKIADSGRYNIRRKVALYKSILKKYGFKRLSSGTNRIAFIHNQNANIVIKVAYGEVGMEANKKEYENQKYLKPFVTKIFEVCQNGVVSLCERVSPIRTREQFLSIAEDIYNIIVTRIIGKYVMEDIGADYFRNWGIRTKNGFGPVILDYPYLYKLDGNKLKCNKIMEDGHICGGEIDYDAGFNHLVCSKCGKQYLGKDLEEKDDFGNQKIIIEEGVDKAMIFDIVDDDGNIIRSYGSGDETPVKKEKKKRYIRPEDVVFEIVDDDYIEEDTNEEYNTLDEYEDTEEELVEQEEIEEVKPVNHNPEKVLTKPTLIKDYEKDEVSTVYNDDTGTAINNSLQSELEKFIEYESDTEEPVEDDTGEIEDVLSKLHTSIEEETVHTEVAIDTDNNLEDLYTQTLNDMKLLNGDLKD